MQYIFEIVAALVLIALALPLIARMFEWYMRFIDTVFKKGG